MKGNNISIIFQFTELLISEDLHFYFSNTYPFSFSSICLWLCLIPPFFLIVNCVTQLGTFQVTLYPLMAEINLMYDPPSVLSSAEAFNNIALTCTSNQWMHFSSFQTEGFKKVYPKQSTFCYPSCVSIACNFAV